MKRSVFILFLSLLCAIVNAQVVEKIYEFDEPEIISIDSYSLIKFQESKQYAEVGSPSLYFINIKNTEIDYTEKIVVR